MIRHPMDWHRCERWWNEKLNCPYRRLIEDDSDMPDEPDEDLTPPILPRTPRWDPPVEKVTKTGVPAEVPAKVPEPLKVQVPVPQVIPVPDAVAEPSKSPVKAPGAVPHPAQDGVPFRADGYQVSEVQQALSRQYQEEAGQSESMQERLNAEWQAYKTAQESVANTYGPPYTNTSQGGTPGGGEAELASSRIAEAALARALSQRQRTTSRKSSGHGLPEEHARPVPTGQGPGPRPRDYPGARPADREAEKSGRVRDAAGVAAATAAGVAEIIRVTRGGGGSSPGRGQGARGRGGMVKRAVITSKPQPAYKVAKARPRARPNYLVRYSTN